MRESENKGEEERWVGEGEEGRRKGGKRAGEMRESYVSMVRRERTPSTVLYLGLQRVRHFPGYFQNFSMGG